MTGLEIRYLPIGALTAYDRNPRTHPEEQIGRNRLGAVAACA